MGDHLVLPDGLQITHRFDVSDDREQLRVITTVSSATSRVPFTLRRFYRKFGGGVVSDLGAHQIDIFNWFYGSNPTSVLAAGGVVRYLVLA